MTPIAARNAERIGTARNGVPDQRRQTPIGSEDDRLDPSATGLVGNCSARGLAATGHGVDEQHSVRGTQRGIVAVPCR